MPPPSPLPPAPPPPDPARFTIGAGHPCLPGHFPGRPVVPGVVLLDEVLARAPFAAAAGDLPAPGALRLERVKFSVPVLPEQCVELAWTPGARGGSEFVCRVEGREVLRGRLALDATPP